jgi:spore coat protein A
LKWNRREILGMTAAGLIVPFESGCLEFRPESRVLPSRIALPKPFEVPLPVPAVLKDSYDVTARESQAQILPGLKTTIWGYNGTFPGPTIEAQSSRPVSLRLRNALPVPIVNHLHGGHTPSDSDGYPTDFVLPQSQREYIYPNKQRAATLWYHDHRMDFTGPQVWRGLAGFYIIRDEAEARLPLPRGDKEIPLLICDRSFDADGSFLYPALDPSLKTMGIQDKYMGGVLGDVILVNGAPWPNLEVSNTRYRFRILNASNARRCELALDPPGAASSFIQIGSDGGLLAAPIHHRTIRIAPAERFDVVIDFSQFRVGAAVTLINKAAGGTPAGQIMRFHVTRSERDDSQVPATLATDVPEPDRSAATVTRIFNFSYRRGMKSWNINGKPFDPARMDATPKLGATEIWQLQTDFSHPLHIHLGHFRVLSHSGRPGPYDAGWKDTIDLGPGQTANILMQFSDYRGRYVFHCHNLEHEDMAMMGNFEVV